MDISELRAIDIHAHYGRYIKEEAPVLTRLMSAEASDVVELAKKANTDLTCVSPTSALMPPGKSDAVLWNSKVSRDIQGTRELRFWVVVDPKNPETYNQADELLKLQCCCGIKVHPESHGYPISEYGDEIFSFACKHNATVLSHSGQRNSIPEDFVPFADEFKDVVIILAHLGNSWDGDPTHQVRAAQSARHGNVFIDTSSAMSIMNGLLEWAVKEVGSDRILYGTDSPLYFAPAQRIRIDYAKISNDDKKKILRENALRLLAISL
jgi:uncharacterized protein